MKKLALLLAAASLMVCACGEDNNNNGNNNEEQQTGQLKASLKTTVTYSDTDNIESVRVRNADGSKAFVVGSKSKRVFEVTMDGMATDSKPLFEPTGMAAEQELTNSAAVSENIVALTHTMLTKDAEGKTTACGGELILFDATTKQSKAVEVGSMPDAVAVSPNKKYIITADEHDSEEAWGKCSLEDIKASVSIIEMGDTIDSAKRVKKIEFTRGLSAPREPEYVAIASDNDTVAVTLQDTHEIALFSLKDVLAKEGDVLSEDVTKISVLPNNPAGAGPWPDGITSFTIEGKIYFAIAGEWNDTVIIVDAEGKTVSNTYITESDVPTNFPCVEDADSPRYSPDSITAFVRGGKQYIALTLKFAGAVIAYDVTNPAEPVFQFVESVGETDKIGCDDKGSLVSPEGISAGSDYLWTANEGENSVTIIHF